MIIKNENFLSSLPDEWTYDRLKDVVSLRNERTDEDSEVEDYLELEDIESSTGRILKRRNTMNVISDVTRFYFGDVLFGKLRPYLEKFYLAQFDGKCTGEILAFKPDRIAGRFLIYCFASSWFIERCKMLAYGAKMPRVNWPTQLAQFYIPLPPLSEQYRIAAYLDASCAAIDAAIAAKRKQVEMLNKIKRSQVDFSVTCGLISNIKFKPINRDWLVQIPSHWRVSQLKRLLNRLDYGISVSTNEEGVYPVLKMFHIADGEIQFKKLDYVDEVSTELLLDENDLLYNRTNSPDQVGKAAIFRKTKADRITFASYLVRLRVNHKIKPDFLNYVLNSDSYLGYVRSLAIPSVQQSNLNSTRYGRMIIPMPPIQEQVVIIATLNDLVSKVAQIKSLLSKQIDTLTAYRKSLIHECVTGQRRINEADLQTLEQRAVQLSPDSIKELPHA